MCDVCIDKDTKKSVSTSFSNIVSNYDRCFHFDADCYESH